ncbi:MAG: hypothetical protein WBM07_16175 [Chitinivibrionales bacterium]
MTIEDDHESLASQAAECREAMYRSQVVSMQNAWIIQKELSAATGKIYLGDLMHVKPIIKYFVLCGMIKTLLRKEVCHEIE